MSRHPLENRASNEVAELPVGILEHSASTALASEECAAAKIMTTCRY